jgi:hypothetical protein
MRPPSLQPDESRYLAMDEQLIMRVRRHWTMLARAAVETLAVVFAAVLVAPLVETA